MAWWDPSLTEVIQLLSMFYIFGPFVWIEGEDWPMNRSPGYVYRRDRYLLRTLLLGMGVLMGLPFVLARLPGSEAAPSDFMGTIFFLCGGFIHLREVRKILARRRVADKLCSLYGQASKLCRYNWHVVFADCQASVHETNRRMTTRKILQRFGKWPNSTALYRLMENGQFLLSARLEDLDRVEGGDLRYHLVALYLVPLSYCGFFYDLAGRDVRIIASVAMEDQRNREAEVDECAHEPPVQPFMQPQPQDPYKWLVKTELVLTFAVNAAHEESWMQMHDSSLYTYDHKSLSQVEMDGKGLLTVAQRPESKLSALAHVASALNQRADPQGLESFVQQWIARIEYDSLVLAMELTAMSDYLSCKNSMEPLATKLGNMFFTYKKWGDLQTDNRDDRASNVKDDVWMSWFSQAVFSVPTLLFLVFYVLYGYIPVEQGTEMLALCLRARLQRQIGGTCQTFSEPSREQYECEYSKVYGLSTQGITAASPFRRWNREKLCNIVEFEAALRLMRGVICHVGDVFHIRVHEHLAVVDKLSRTRSQLHELVDRAGGGGGGGVVGDLDALVRGDDGPLNIATAVAILVKGGAVLGFDGQVCLNKG